MIKENSEQEEMILLPSMKIPGSAGILACHLADWVSSLRRVSSQGWLRSQSSQFHRRWCAELGHEQLS
jgi:hypothetical protein